MHTGKVATLAGQGAQAGLAPDDVALPGAGRVGGCNDLQERFLGFLGFLNPLYNPKP